MNGPRLSLTIAAFCALVVMSACQPIQAPSAGSEAATAPAATTAPVHSETFDPTKYANVWVQAIEEIENDGRSLLRVSYPVTEQDAINARMEAVTQEFIDEYRMTAAEIEAAYQEYKKETGKEAATFVTHYRQNFDVSIANENVIFFDIVRSVHTGGTGNSFAIGYIFDRRRGAELSIADLFVDDGYLELLSSLSREALAERVDKEELASDLEWVQGGTEPTSENFDNILLRVDGTVLVMFDKYQVAAGVEGVVEIELPIDAIAGHLKPGIRQLLGIGSDAAAPASPTVEAVEIEEIENDERSQLYVSYPVTGQEAVDARIEEITQQFIDEFRMTAAEIEKDFQDNKKETGQESASFVTHYRQHHEVTIANEQIMFFAVARSIYTGGTGNTLVSSYIFDLGSGTEITIPDLFADDSYLHRLSELSREALAERLRTQIAEREPDADDDRKKALFESDSWLFEGGTEPTNENFDYIVFRDDGTFLIRFDKYQFAPGVDGPVEIMLAVAEITDLLKPEVRDLLGIEADNTSLGFKIANVAKRSAAFAFAPAAAATFFNVPDFRSSPDLSVLTFRSSSLPLATAQDEINCHEVACVALTFDDGPSFYTEGLLDTLKEHNVKATFFVLGTQVRIQSETVQRMFQEGHQIGNHTWDHPNLTKMGDAQIREQLQLADDLISQIIGMPTPFMRPPYGAYNDRVLAASGLPIIFWSVDPLDWKDRDAATVASRIIDAPVGAIILAHDIHKSTVAAVPAIIAALKSRGIHFVTVTKLYEPHTLLPENVYKNQADSPSQ